MSGTYPPYGYGGRRRAYEDPGYGDDQWHAGGHGHEDADEPAYRGRESDYDQSRYAAYRGDRPAVPAQGYPPLDADPYPGDPYPGDPHPGDPHRGTRYGEVPNYPEPSAYPPPGGYERYPGHPARQDHWDERDSGRGWQAAGIGPGSGQSAPASAPAERPARRTKRRGARIVVAFAVTLAVLALVAFGGWRYARPFLDQWPATLAKPERLAGLELSTEPALQQAADDIAADIRKDVKVDEAVAAFYHDPAAAEKIVALVGGTAFLASPKAELEEAFSSARGEGMSIDEVVPVNAGPLGGLARCASAEQQAEGGAKVPLSVCAWADHGSLLIGLFFHRSINESAALLQTIRGEILKR